MFQLTGGSGPTPLSLQRFGDCLKSVVQLLECPICLEASPPSAYQCCNGHLICGNCRTHSERCPVCRVQLGTKGRCLLADKVYSLLTTTFLPNSSQINLINRVLNINNKKRKNNLIFNGTNGKDMMPKLKLKSRLLQQNHQLIDNGSRNDNNIKINEIPITRNRLLPSSEKVKEKYYHCPAGNGCNKTFPPEELLQHIQMSHEGPLIQYFPKKDTTALRLPISGLTVINYRGLQFFVHIVPHKTVNCLLLWLWVSGDSDIANLYNFTVTTITDSSIDKTQIKIIKPCNDMSPSLVTKNGIVLPLTMSENDIILSHLAENCLNLHDFDDINDKVNLTIHFKNDNSNNNDNKMTKLEE